MSDFMSSVLQGILQGMTEYLPVSSSGHLVIFQHVFGGMKQSLAFDLLLHLATVLSTLIYFRRDILSLLAEFFRGFASSRDERGEGWFFGWAVLFGSVPTAVIGLLLKDSVEAAGQSLVFVGSALFVTGAVLFLTSLLPQGRKKICVTIGIVVGIAQGLAVFPGISRSGMTLAAGILCGLSAAEAFRFSFLLSLPAVTGAALLELSEGIQAAELPQGWAAGAFLSGIAALYLLRRFVLRGKWRAFALYCAAAGLLTLVFLR